MSYLERLLSHEEEVRFATRPHWTAFAGQCWRVFALLLLAIAIGVAANLQLRAVIARWHVEQELMLRVAIVFVLVVYPLAGFLYRYVQWRTERYVVTNHRVIQLSGLLSKRVLDSSLEKVNDVMLEQSLFGRLLDYGNLEILTASELAGNKFTRVARPLAFKSTMLEARQQLEGGYRGSVEDKTKLIADLALLHEQGILSEGEFQDKKAKLLAEM